MPKVLHYNSIHFFSDKHPRCIKYLLETMEDVEK